MAVLTNKMEGVNNDTGISNALMTIALIGRSGAGNLYGPSKFGGPL
jgi:hypothetical protein